MLSFLADPRDGSKTIVPIVADNRCPPLPAAVEEGLLLLLFMVVARSEPRFGEVRFRSPVFESSDRRDGWVVTMVGGAAGGGGAPTELEDGGPGGRTVVVVVVASRVV